MPAASSRTLVEVLARQRQDRGDAVAFRYGQRATTYAQFDDRTNQVGNALSAVGIGPGDRIAYLGKNIDYYYELWLGTVKVGAVLVPLNWRYAPPEVADVVVDAEAKILVIGPGVDELARDVVPRLSPSTIIISMEQSQEGWIDFCTWRDAAPTEPPAHAVDESDIAIQLYTSGTTGRPKGVLLSHRNVLDKRGTRHGEWVEPEHFTPDSIQIVCLPVCHIAGNGIVVYALSYGSQSLILPEFDASKILDHIEKDRVTHILLVPSAMQILLRHPRGLETDYSSLEMVLYGSSPISPNLLRECLAVMQCRFVQIFGATETTGEISYLPSEDHSVDGSKRMLSAGKAYPGTELAIVDAAGDFLAPGEIGEIVARSGGTMSGYWKQPEATRDAFTSDGWYRTGDAGYLDEDGYLFIQDRIKDMIISGGENVYPTEVENALLDHPAVAEVAVIGVPNEKWGESVKAVVVLKQGKDATGEDIIAFARARIAGFKVPRSVDFLEALPRNTSGKILRRKLREIYWTGFGRQVS